MQNPHSDSSCFCRGCCDTCYYATANEAAARLLTSYLQDRGKGVRLGAALLSVALSSHTHLLPQKRFAMPELLSQKGSLPSTSSCAAVFYSSAAARKAGNSQRSASTWERIGANVENNVQMRDALLIRQPRLRNVVCDTAAPSGSEYS